MDSLTSSPAVALAGSGAEAADVRAADEPRILRYRCPACDAPVRADAPACHECGVSFQESDRCRPMPEFDADVTPLHTGRLLVMAIGMTLLLAVLFPFVIGILAGLAEVFGTRVMYGWSRQIPPPLMLAVNYALTYVPTFLVVWWLLRRGRVTELLPHRYQSVLLFGMGSVAILGFNLLRILASMIEGGGASYAMASFSVLILYPAAVLLGIASIRLVYGLGYAQRTRALRRERARRQQKVIRASRLAQ